MDSAMLLLRHSDNFFSKDGRDERGEEGKDGNFWANAAEFSVLGAKWNDNKKTWSSFTVSVFSAQ